MLFLESQTHTLTAALGLHLNPNQTDLEFAAKERTDRKEEARTLFCVLCTAIAQIIHRLQRSCGLQVEAENLRSVGAIWAIAVQRRQKEQLLLLCSLCVLSRRKRLRRYEERRLDRLRARRPKSAGKV